MNVTTEKALSIVLLGTILFFALKYGTIGGAGGGARRNENPILYWMGVSITGFALVVAILFIFI